MGEGVYTGRTKPVAESTFEPTVEAKAVAATKWRKAATMHAAKNWGKRW